MKALVKKNLDGSFVVTEQVDTVVSLSQLQTKLATAQAILNKLIAERDAAYLERIKSARAEVNETQAQIDAALLL